MYGSLAWGRGGVEVGVGACIPFAAPDTDKAAGPLEPAACSRPYARQDSNL